MNDGRRKIEIAYLCVLLLLAVVFLDGCVNGPDDVVVLPPFDDYHTAIAEGWLEFGAGRYNNAITAFDEATEIDPTLSQAYLGLGWSYAMIDQMEISLSNVELAIVKDSESPDGYAAKAFVHLVQDEYEAAIEAAGEAIVFGGESYVFSQIPDVQTRNLRLLMAESYYATGQYADAQNQVDILNPDNNLDQDSRTYTEDLLLEMESLGSTVLEELIN
ncbi:hypothetical protein ACFL6S_25280 [Candidatus Poribacteria bacterium]